jgi:DNA polymerase
MTVKQETSPVYTLSNVDVIKAAADHILDDSMPDYFRRDVLFEHFVHQNSHCAMCKVIHEKRDYLPIDNGGLLLQSRFPCQGWGNADADIMILGIGPGAEEDEAGEPFIGPAGQVLREALVEAKGVEMQPEEVYMTNCIICRPCEVSDYNNMRNRDPVAKELQNCKERLLIEIALVKPKVIVCMGAIPYKHMTGLANVKVGSYLDKVSILKYTDWKGEECEAKLTIAYHPSYVDRNKGSSNISQIRKAFGSSLRLAVKLAKE